MPTRHALFEASVVQYDWLQDFRPDEDQFNSIHEKLLEVMKRCSRDMWAGIPSISPVSKTASKTIQRSSISET